MAKIVSINKYSSSIYEKEYLSDLLWRVYGVNRRSMEDCPNSMFNLHPVDYAKEFGTIKLSTGRRTGKTSAIADFCNRISGEWIFSSLNQHQTDSLSSFIISGHNAHIIKKTKEYMMSEHFKINFFSVKRINHFKGKRLKGIIVDNASFVSEPEIEHIYEKLTPLMGVNPNFVFVG